jgi:pimeloyl-ACP methyl ester carboxylesterase
MPLTRSRPELYYERHGRGEPLLCITGFAISAAVFEPVLPLYARRFECLLYDNRGAGRSQAPPRPTSIAELAFDATRLLDELRIDSAHVYGASMGGMIAQELAIRFPERVRGLILASTWPGGPRAIRPTLREFAVLGLGTIAALREQGRPVLAPALFSPAFRREHPERVRHLLERFHRHRAPLPGAAAHFLASIYHDTVSRLCQIQAPTLVLHGEYDAMTPLDNARLLAARIPDAELQVVKGAGHAHALERPDLCYELIVDWLERRGPIRPGVPRVGASARLEPVSRALGLPLGALRTGRSLVGLVRDRAIKRLRSAPPESPR